MTDSAEMNVWNTQRIYFSLKYKISFCTCCARFRLSTGKPIMPYMFKTDRNTVWQLLLQNEEIFLNLKESECHTIKADVRTSYVNAISSNPPFTHCNLRNQDMSNNVKLHTNTSCQCSYRNSTSHIAITEILCELFIHPLQKQKKNSKFLSKDLKCLMQNENLSDVTLVTKQEEFKVHKALLSARSPVFNAMFRSEMKETKENKIFIKDIDGEVMNQVLLYIYTDRVNKHIVKNIAENVLIVAEKYDLERLKVICGIVLSSNLTAENIFYNSSLAECYELQHLKKAIIKFITTKHNEIMSMIPDTLTDFSESSEEEENAVHLE